MRELFGDIVCLALVSNGKIAVRQLPSGAYWLPAYLNKFLEKPDKVIKSVLKVISIQEKFFDTVEFLGTCAQQTHTGLIYQKFFGLNITKISALKSDE
jgi:hypothetical protein